MADILLDNETIPTTPAASKSIIFVDSTTKKLATLDDGGTPRGILSRNNATAAQGALATTDTYLTNSGILIPSFGMKVGMMFVWHISAVKTAASTAAPIWTFRIGTNQSTADTSRLALTATGVQVATAFDGILTAVIFVPTVSATGTISGSGGALPNFGGGGSGVSGTFDNTGTIAGNYLGISITTGASAAWTVNGLSCYLLC